MLSRIKISLNPDVSFVLIPSPLLSLFSSIVPKHCRKNFTARSLNLACSPGRLTRQSRKEVKSPNPTGTEVIPRNTNANNNSQGSILPPARLKKPVLLAQASTSSREMRSDASILGISTRRSP